MRPSRPSLPTPDTRDPATHPATAPHARPATAPHAPPATGDPDRDRDRGAWLSLAAQLTSAALAYALQIALARSLGTAAFGAYATALAWIAPLVVLAGCGLPSVALRFLPTYRAAGDAARLAGFLRAAERIALAASVALAALGTALAFTFARDPAPLVVALWTLPLTVQLRLHTELARAAGHFRAAFLVPLLQPLTMLAAALLARELLGPLTPAIALGLPALGALAVLPFQRSLTRRAAPRVAPRHDTRLWLRVGLGVLLVDAAFLLVHHADAVLVAALAGPRGTALFSVAAGTAAFAMFPMIAVGSTAVPTFAPLWTLGRKDELQRVARRAVLRAFTAQLAVTALLAATARPLLALAGADFEEARVPLLLVLAGQLANTATGYVGSIANMTGHEAAVRRPLWAVAAAHVALVLAGLHLAGVPGAAAATALTTLAWNLWVHHLVVRHVGVHVSVFAALAALWTDRAPAATPAPSPALERESIA